MKVEDQPFFLLPVDNYRADLNIVDSEGRELIILSDREFEKYTGNSMKHIIDMYLRKLKTDLPEEHFRLIEDYRVIAVLFNREDNSYYEKIKVTWVQRFVNRKHKSKISISEYVEIPLYLPRYGFEHGATSAIYLSVKTSSKYRITETPTIRDLLRQDLVFEMRSRKASITVAAVIDAMSAPVYPSVISAKWDKLTSTGIFWLYILII